MNPVIFKHCDGKRNKIRWLKVHITIRLPSCFKTPNLIWNWKVLKRPKNQGFYNNTEKISECCVSVGFKKEPDRIREPTSGSIIWVVYTSCSFKLTKRSDK